MERSLVEELKEYLSIEVRESEEYLHLIQRCPAALPRIIFKVLLYDSILHSEIINDLILLYKSSNTDSMFKECINYIKSDLSKISENINKEETALKELEKLLKNTENHLLESLIQYICNDEENHIKLLKALVKEVKG